MIEYSKNKAQNVKIAASMACADFLQLKEQINELEQAGIEMLHCDAMDGHFVPNLSLFPDFVASLKSYTDIPLEVHLMVANPAQFVGPFVEAGADMICFHVEAVDCAHRLADKITARGVKAGIALNPITHPLAVEYVLPRISFLTIMAVDPGFYGQKFIGEVLHKVSYFRELIDNKGYSVEIVVDGNMNVENAKKCIAAGANVIVAGTSSIFKKPGGLLANARAFREALV